MKFGYREMKEFAEQSSDPRVQSMWRRLNENRSRCAKMLQTIIDRESTIGELKAELAFWSEGKSHLLKSQDTDAAK